MLNLIKAMGSFPMLERKNWDESQWDWKRTILNFRKYILKRDDDIFNTNKEAKNEIDTVRDRFLLFDVLIDYLSFEGSQ